MADWKKQLSQLIQHVDRRARPQPLKQPQVEAFLRATVAPALEDVARELRKQGRQTQLETASDVVKLTILREDDLEFTYAVRSRTLHKPGFALAGLSPKADDTYQRAEVFLNGKAQDYGIGHYSWEQVIHHFLHEYGQHVRWQTAAGGSPDT